MTQNSGGRRVLLQGAAGCDSDAAGCASELRGSLLRVLLQAVLRVTQGAVVRDSNACPSLLAEVLVDCPNDSAGCCRVPGVPSLLWASRRPS